MTRTHHNQSLDILINLIILSNISQYDDGMFFLNKEFCANGISLRVKTGISLLDEKHLVDKTIKYSLALF